MSQPDKPRLTVGIDVQPLVSTGGIATYTWNLLQSLEGVEVVPLFGAVKGAALVKERLTADLLARLVVPPSYWRLLARCANSWEGGSFPGLAGIEDSRSLHGRSQLSAGGWGLDLIHGPNFLLPPTRLPAVITIHDLSALRQPQCHTAKVRRQLQRVVAVAKRARRIIADSQATADDVLRFIGVAPGQVSVIPLATGLSAPPDSSPVLQRWQLLQKPYLLHVGAVEPRKNLPRLIAAFGASRAARTHQLVLVGPLAWGAKEARAAAQDHNGVRFLGAVPDSDLSSIYAGAVSLVYPSLFEGFGLPPLEAMACGCPVIASNCSSLPEVVSTAGVLVDPYDVLELAKAIDRVALDPVLRDDLRERGRQRARQFSWKRTAQLTEQVYREALIGAS